MTLWKFCRSAIILGTGIPLGLFLIWNAVILGTVSDNVMGLDPIQQLRSTNGTIGVSLWQPPQCFWATTALKVWWLLFF